MFQRQFLVPVVPSIWGKSLKKLIVTPNSSAQIQNKLCSFADESYF
jgi:hypothetical protein